VVLEDFSRGGPLRLDGRKEPVISDSAQLFSDAARFTLNAWSVYVALRALRQVVEVAFDERVDDAPAGV
jgi:hypothetical protein